MTRQCPANVICFERMTLFFLICISLWLICYVGNRKLVLNDVILPQRQNKFVNDFHDPYSPPLRPGMHVNIRTQGENSEYRQVGILTRTSGDETILPLMGRTVLSARDKWQYYSISDKNTAVKLPVSSNGRSCTGEYGCDSLHNEDQVFVEGYNDRFTVTLYETNNLRYIPNIS